METDEPLCARCGVPIDVGTPSGDFCPDCATNIRNQLKPGLQFRRLWTQVSPPLLRLPLLTLLFIAINVAVYSVIASSPVSGQHGILEATLEMNGVNAMRGEWWRFLTYAFVQIRLLHLLSNVLLLAALGWVAEPVFGTISFLLIWVATAAAGSIAELLVYRPRFIGFGASGVVFGLAGTLLGMYLLARVPLSIRSRYLRITLLSAFILVDFFADWFVFRRLNPGHVGGLLAGLALGLMLPSKEAPVSKKVLAYAATAIVLLSSSFFAESRQKVWLDLEDMDTEQQQPGGFSNDPSSISKLEPIVARRPDILRAHVLLAEALQANHRDDEAIRQYRYIVAKRPTLSDAWSRMGSVFMDSKQYDAAIDAFSHALKVILNDRIRAGEDGGQSVARVRLQLAGAYESSGKLDEAMAQWSEVLREASPDSPYHLFARHELERLQAAAGQKH